MRIGEAGGEIERYERAGREIRPPLLFQRKDQLARDKGVETGARRDRQPDRSVAGQQVAFAFEEIDLAIDQDATDRAVRVAQDARADTDIGGSPGEDLLGGVERDAAVQSLQD